MDNNQFLDRVLQSFKVFLETGSRSNEKLKPLHGSIAEDLSDRLGNGYEIKSLGFLEGKEGNIEGRYIDKKVDITVYKDEQPIAGIGVKFVQQNYAQNSNNYFENMLGETANIRSNNIPYFQIFIIPEVLPYYKRNGIIKHWERFDSHYISKYEILSNDNICEFIHTPIKTLLYVLKLPEPTEIRNKVDYVQRYQDLSRIEVRDTDFGNFGNSVIINDYEVFIDKVIHRILSI